MFTGLSLDQAPPFRAPLKFFLTAPIFAIFAGIFALFSNSFEIHSPNIIASIHLITIGYMVMIIFGALQQMLPVVAGAVIPKAKLTANVTYYLLIGGLISFSLAFFMYEKILFFIASTLLLIALLYFISIALLQLFTVQNKSYIVIGIIISLCFFIIAFLFGIHLLISYATANITALHYDFALIHYNYVFFGFIFLLIVSITIQVVPMFWVASSFNKEEQKIIIFSTSALLLFYLTNIIFNLNLENIYKLLMSTVIIFFVYITIKKLLNRKRKLKDISVYFYITSMIFLLLGVIYWLSLSFFELPTKPLAILFGFGFTISLMNGMLYKIVPFLTWFHLNSKGLFDIPTMREMIPIPKMQQQYFIHLNSVIFFTIGFLFQISIFVNIAIILFIISNILFFINIYKSSQVYFKREHEDGYNMTNVNN